MSSKNLAISVRGLTKEYRIAHNAEKHLRVTDAAVASLKGLFRKSSFETFKALDDVSFDVEKGDVLGIIGRNGAGKSTLLKVLSRITEPTAGEIHVFGRIGSLLEVGTGFHPELTGRENIYLNGAILGMRKREIDRQFDAIVDFAEVDRFLDTPVKRFSSGMYVRLAFSVAAHLNPEILIVDEVLAVGDAQFQQKCLGKMQDVSQQEGRTVLFVSHNMAAVRSLCKHCILLEGGEVTARGQAGSVLDRYLASFSQGPTDLTNHVTDRSGTGDVRFTSFGCEQGGVSTTELIAGRDASIVFGYTNNAKIGEVRLLLTVFNMAGVPLFHVNNSLRRERLTLRSAGKITCHLPRMNLNLGRYRVAVALQSLGGQSYDHLSCIGTFDVVGSCFWETGESPEPQYSAILAEHHWELASSSEEQESA